MRSVLLKKEIERVYRKKNNISFKEKNLSYFYNEKQYLLFLLELFRDARYEVLEVTPKLIELEIDDDCIVVENIGQKTIFLAKDDSFLITKHNDEDEVLFQC